MTTWLPLFTLLTATLFNTPFLTATSALDKTSTTSALDKNERDLEEVMAVNAAEASAGVRDLALTPWWPLRLAEGDTLTVDCGVFTPQQQEVRMRWMKNEGSDVAVIEEVKPRSVIFFVSD